MSENEKPPQPPANAIQTRESLRGLGIEHQNEMVPVEASPNPMQAALYNIERFDRVAFVEWLKDRPHLHEIAQKCPPDEVYMDLVTGHHVLVLGYAKNVHDARRRGFRPVSERKAFARVLCIFAPGLEFFREAKDLRCVTNEVRASLAPKA